MTDQHNPFQNPSNPPGAPPFATREDKTAAGDDDFSIDSTKQAIPPLELGTFAAELEDLTKELSKKGNEQWAWTFRMIGGPNSNRTIRAWTSLLPNAVWRRDQWLMVLGVAAPDEHGRIVAKLKRSDIVGRKCRVVLTSDTYNDRPTVRVKDILPA